MKKIILKSGLTLISILTLGSLTVPSTIAFAETSAIATEQTEEIKEFNFNPNLNEIQKIDGIDDNGQEFSVIAEPINNGMTRAVTQSWKVWYTSGAINAHFYMGVSNNKVTSAYNKKIVIYGGTHSNEKLSKTNTYARLSFKATTVGGWYQGNFWLQGKVTGKGNNIKVTWDM